MTSVSFRIPPAFHEIFGERQTRMELGVTLGFVSLVSVLLFVFLWEPSANLATWRSLASWLLVIDIVAGCAANFTRGTNDFYATRTRQRWIFIAIHFHLLGVTWLCDENMISALIVWAYTIVSASVVHMLQPPKQVLLGGALLAAGLILMLLLPLPSRFNAAVSILFLLKVAFAFAVNHYPSGADA